jgi:tetratricopeptide (TPR) repeat protein
VWAGIGLVVAAAAGAWYAWSDRVPDRSPPEAALEGVDPQVAQAVRSARDQVLQSPRSADAWGEYGEVLDANLFFAEGRECYAQAELLDPKNARWPFLLGMSLRPLDPETAVVKLRRAVELNPEKADMVTCLLVDMLLATGRSDEARERLEALVRNEPNHMVAHLGLARLALAAGDFEGCARHARACLNSPFTRRAAHIVLAELRQRQGDAAGAAAEQERVAESTGDREWAHPFSERKDRRRVGQKARIVHAGRLMDVAQYREAVAELQQVVADYPSSAEGWMMLGYALVQVRQDPAAEKALAEAIRHDPTQPRPYFYLGIVLHRRGDRAGAAARFREAIAAKPDYLLAHLNLGITLNEDGKRAEAIEAFRGALQCQPNHATAHANLGELLLKEGKTDEARGHLEQAVQLNPKDKRAAELLAGLKKGDAK